MRRVLGILLLCAAVAAVAVLGTGAAEPDRGKTYKVELDNAFGLIDGADVKVAGVRAGKITKMSLDRSDMRALISFELNRGGFDDLRADVHCETRPQSLIGEYFLDCQPGTSPRRLAEGSTIPVEQTEATIPLDLINNIYRRPVRERFSILFSEFGAGLAARGGDLNETIRRAVPALRQTNRLLAILRDQRRVIRDLYGDADRVIGRLADERTDVSRFVREARDTAATSASRADGIRAQWRTFPTFLRELRPTMARLQGTAEAQIPALRNLNASAGTLERFFRTLGPFSEASRPAFRTLAGASRTGRKTMVAAQPNIAQLREAVDDLPEAANNLAITLEHIDDPKNASEKDVRAGRGPDGGYTGLEALIRYFFAQSQAINLYDANNYMLKASVFLDRPCANYATVRTVTNGNSPPRCRAWLGPNQPGITSPDTTVPPDEIPPTHRPASRAARDRDAGAKAAAARSGGVSDGSGEQLLEYLLR